MRMDIVIAGVGGQGTLLASEVLSRYALHEGFNVVGTETIGAAQRGGSVVSHIRISEQSIFSPLVPHGQADWLLGFEPIEGLRHWGKLKPTGKYLMNLDRVPTVMCNMGLDHYPGEDRIQAAMQCSGVDGHVLHATRMAHELGNGVLMNAIMLGALAALEPRIETEAVRNLLAQVVPAAWLVDNQRAFETGLSSCQ